MSLSKPVADVDPIKEAAALRAMYRLQQSALCAYVEGGMATAVDGNTPAFAGVVMKVRVAPILIGFHPDNRHGVIANGELCVKRLSELAGHWDDGEAAHDAVLVEEEPGKERYLVYNQEKVEGDRYLAEIKVKKMPFGSLGTGTTNQVLKNIACSAFAGRDHELTDSDGNISPDKVKTKDSEMHAAAMIGIVWEILSWKLEKERPGAALRIQAALNNKRSVQLVQHEMQAVVALAKICTAEEAMASKVAYDSVVAKMRNAGFHQVADDSAFVDLMSFVCDTGAWGPILENLLAFHEKFVDPDFRRLRLSAFALTAGLRSRPWCRTLLLKTLYNCPAEQITDGFCSWIPSLAVKSFASKAQVLDEAEEAQRRWHVTYKDHGIYEKMPGKGVILLGKADCDLGRACVQKAQHALPPNTPPRTQAAVLELCQQVVWHWEAEIRKNVPAEKASLLLKAAEPKPQTKSPAAKAPGAEGVRIMRFAHLEGGAPEAPKEEPQPKQKPVTSLCEQVGTRTADAAFAAKALDALWGVQGQAGLPTKDDLAVFPKTVVAKRHFAVGELCLVPLVDAVRYIIRGESVTGTTKPHHHPHAVALERTEPKDASTSKQQPDSTNGPMHSTSTKRWWIQPCQSTDHTKPFAPPFWFMQRSAFAEAANMGMMYVTREVAINWTNTSGVTCRLGHAAAFETQQVPVAVNTKAVNAGTELVLLWHKTAVGQGHPNDVPKRGKTWADGQRAENRKRVKAAEILASVPDHAK